MQRNFTPLFTIIVFRLPALPVFKFQGEGLVQHRRHQSITLWLLQGSQVSKRLDKRTDRAIGIQSPVESRKLRVFATDKRQNFTCVFRGYHQSSFKSLGRVAAGQPWQGVSYGILSGILNSRVKGGEYPKPFTS